MKISELNVEPSNPNEFIWEQMFRPPTVEDVALPNDFREKFNKYIEAGRIPSLIFYSPKPGTGKTTTARALANSIGCTRPMFINASLDNSIENIRTKVYQYGSTVSVLESSQKVVILDECLEENTDIRIFNEAGDIVDKRIGDLTIGEKLNLPSFNMETGKIENDTAEVIKDRLVDVYEVELEDGAITLMTENHPVIIIENCEFKARPISCGLKVNDLVVIHKN